MRPTAGLLLRLTVACSVAPTVAIAQPAPTRTVRVARSTTTHGGAQLQAARTAAPLVADGRLDEGAWQDAAVARAFVQRRPTAGAAATRATEVRILYDDQALWIGARLAEPAADGPRSTLGRRDYDLPSDWLHVLIDSYLDRRTAFRFAVNPSGVRQDASLSGDEEWSEDRGWNAVWDVATAIERGAWTAEFRIPWSALRFRDAGDSAERRIGIQFIRDDARTNERTVWAPMPPDANGYVSRFGELGGLRLARLPARRELVPYVMAGYDGARSAAAGAIARRPATASVGADLRLGLGAFTLSSTILPDFGQVEADPSEVNLTGIETFRPEQRPFFLEGSEIFQIPLWGMPWQFGSSALFYSRRVGRAPQIALPDDAGDSDVPAAADLLAAVKLTGKTADGWSIGGFDAVTDGADARYLDGAGATRTLRVEPRTNYAMLRANRELRGGASAIGFALTSTHRALDSASAATLHASAFVGAIDARHRMGDHNFRATLAASRVAGSTDAISETQRSIVHLLQRPDRTESLDSTRTSLEGATLELFYWKQGGMWRWGVLQHLVTDGFEANDLGYHPVSGQLVSGGWLGREQYTPSRHLRSWSSYLNLRSLWTLERERKDLAASLFAEAELHSAWSIDASLGGGVRGLSVQALRGGPALATPAYLSGGVGVRSNPRRALSGGARIAFRREGDAGQRFLVLSPTLTLRPSSRAEVALAPTLNWMSAPAQYLESPTDARGTSRHVVGALQQHTAALGVRAAYTFTPNLGVQLWAQPFASAGRYAGLREVVEPRAPLATERFRTVAYARPEEGDWSLDFDRDGGVDAALANPDFHVRELLSNAVLRWEFRPGSSLFLVWSQTRDASGLGHPFSPSADVRRLLGAAPRNVLLAKVSWWTTR